MRLKKVFGVIFIILAFILALPIIGQPDKVIRNLYGWISILKGDMDKYQIGTALGHFTFEILYISAVFFLLKCGIRWLRKPAYD